MDELVANFTAITGAEPARAQQYLQLTDSNIEQAIQLYFESDGVDMGATLPQPPAQAAQPSARSRSGYTEGDDGIVTIDSDDEGATGSGGAPAGNAYEDDEAMARRLQEEMYGAGGGQEEIRAPMARTTETLVGPGSNWQGGNDEDDMQAAVMEQMMNRQRRGPWRAEG